jgi:Domain of unknown function (DUF6531)
LKGHKCATLVRTNFRSCAASGEGSGQVVTRNRDDAHSHRPSSVSTAGQRASAGLLHYSAGWFVRRSRRKSLVLPYTVWLTPIDQEYQVTIPSPITSESSSPRPSQGLELHLPAGTVIRDYHGQVVTRIGLTRIPIRRPPFPLPANVPVPVYFTIQPGGAFVEVGGSRYGAGKGAQLIYPNTHRAPAGTEFNFWDYDPDGTGWYSYGTGHVDKNRRDIVPDPGVVIHRFTGAMVATPDSAPPEGPNPDPCDPDCGDPVDPATGLFVYSHTDLAIRDVISFAFKRTYRQGDPISRAFGVGTSDNADIFLTGDFHTYQYADLIRVDGSRVHFTRTSPGTFWSTAVFTNTTSNTPYFGATIAWGVGGYFGWKMTLKNSTGLYFLEADSRPTRRLAEKSIEAIISEIKYLTRGSLLPHSNKPLAHSKQPRRRERMQLLLLEEAQNALAVASNPGGFHAGHPLPQDARLQSVKGNEPVTYVSK